MGLSGLQPTDEVSDLSEEEAEAILALVTPEVAEELRKAKATMAYRQRSER